MKLRSVVTELPSREVTNSDVTRLIHQHSTGHFTGDLDRTVHKIAAFLRYSGSVTRYWLDTGERPIDLLRTAANSALAKAGITAGGIDVLIYTGVSRGSSNRRAPITRPRRSVSTTPSASTSSTRA